jgi:hypothetical protein
MRKLLFLNFNLGLGSEGSQAWQVNNFMYIKLRLYSSVQDVVDKGPPPLPAATKLEALLSAVAVPPETSVKAVSPPALECLSDLPCYSNDANLVNSASSSSINDTCTVGFHNHTTSASSNRSSLADQNTAEHLQERPEITLPALGAISLSGWSFEIKVLPAHWKEALASWLADDLEWLLWLYIPLALWACFDDNLPLQLVVLQLDLLLLAVGLGMKQVGCGLTPSLKG